MAHLDLFVTRLPIGAPSRAVLWPFEKYARQIGPSPHGSG